MKKISYLGPKGTYSEQATRTIVEKIENIELIDMISHEAVAKSLANKEVDMSVMACYNYLEGLVQECLDLIYENDLRIIGMQRLPIVFSLGAHSKDVDISNIYSHPKALAQCSEYLWKNYKDSKQIPVTSTAAAAQKVLKEKEGLAIASTKALDGLEILAEDIGNKKQGRTNFTDFYLVSRVNGHQYNPEKQYLTMVAITPHVDKEGLLAQILGQVAYHNLNNAKIHSRPALDYVDIDGLEPQMFYLEIMDHQDTDDFKRCIDSLKYKLTPKGKDIEVVRVLGSYERP